MNSLPDNLWSDLIGLPFKARGRGPNEYDCYGLLREIYKRRGIIVPDVLSYKDVEDPNAVNQLIVEHLTKFNDWRPCSIAPGVGLLFRRGSVPAHVGVAIDSDRFIHASEDFWQVTVGRLSRGYKFQLVGAYDYAV